jgi:hypothetical protein
MIKCSINWPVTRLLLQHPLLKSEVNVCYDDVRMFGFPLSSAHFSLTPHPEHPLTPVAADALIFSVLIPAS